MLIRDKYTQKSLHEQKKQRKKNKVCNIIGEQLLYLINERTKKGRAVQLSPIFVVDANLLPNAFCLWKGGIIHDGFVAQLFTAADFAEEVESGHDIQAPSEHCNTRGNIRFLHNFEKF